MTFFIALQNISDCEISSFLLAALNGSTLFVFFLPIRAMKIKKGVLKNLQDN